MLQILWPNIDHILSKKSEYLHWAEGKKQLMLMEVVEEMKSRHLASDWRIKVGVNAFLSFKDFNMIFWSGFTPCLYRRDLYCLEKCDRYKRRPKIKINYFFSFQRANLTSWGRNQAQESWDKIESHSCHRHLHQHTTNSLSVRASWVANWQFSRLFEQHSREMLYLIMNSQTSSLVEVLRAIKIIHQYYYKRTAVQSKSSLDTPINYLHLGKN